MTTNINLQASADLPVTESAVINYVDPATLLVDRNIRTDARLDRDFVASVRDLGVLVPIVAVRTAEGSLRVRYGHRRTLAAVEAGHAYVPVVVVADEATDDAAEVERLVGQYAENEHRTGLSTSERVEVFTQLEAFGVSAAQIAKRTKTRRRDVDAALSVSKSDLARAAAERYAFLDLTQAATVAEFEDDAEAVKALVKAARDGGFDHLAQRLRDERAEAAARAQVVDELTAAGVTVIERPGWMDAASAVEDLTDSDGRPLTVDGHADCAGHAAYVGSHWSGYGDDIDHDEGMYVAVYVCTDPAAHGHRSRWEQQRAQRPGLTDEQKAAANAERRRVVANNKAWRSAETVRRAWLTTFLARKTAPKGAAGFVAQSLVRADHELRRALERAHLEARDLFGGSVSAEETSDGRAQMIGLGLVLAAYEQGTGVWSWRAPSDSTAWYLRYLAAQGYELSEVERLACGEQSEGSAEAMQ